jgi:hypothetical protein
MLNAGVVEFSSTVQAGLWSIDVPELVCTTPMYSSPALDVVTLPELPDPVTVPVLELC